MTRYTVVWFAPAADELGVIWLEAADRSIIAGAADEIDSLLKVNPGSKGSPRALAKLDEATVALLSLRVASLPEDLRSIEFGPLEALYSVSEEDRMVRVVLLRLRKTR